MKEINTTLSIAITILIIFVTSILSVNNREVNSSVITIEKGMSLNSVSNLLLENEIIVNQNIFKLKVITRGLASKIPTGRFLVDGNISDAILEATKNRIRPIFMSTLTSVLGMLPLVIFPGAGAELYRGLGSVVIGGLTLSAVLTLIIIPSLLALFLAAIEGKKVPLAKPTN